MDYFENLLIFLEKKKMRQNNNNINSNNSNNYRGRGRGRGNNNNYNNNQNSFDSINFDNNYRNNNNRNNSNRNNNNNNNRNNNNRSEDNIGFQSKKKIEIKLKPKINSQNFGTQLKYIDTHVHIEYILEKLRIDYPNLKKSYPPNFGKKKFIEKKKKL